MNGILGTQIVLAAFAAALAILAVADGAWFSPSGDQPARDEGWPAGPAIAPMAGPRPAPRAGDAAGFDPSPLAAASVADDRGPAAFRDRRPLGNARGPERLGMAA